MAPIETPPFASPLRRVGRRIVRNPFSKARLRPFIGFPFSRGSEAFRPDPFRFTAETRRARRRGRRELPTKGHEEDTNECKRDWRLYSLGSCIAGGAECFCSLPLSVLRSPLPVLRGRVRVGAGFRRGLSKYTSRSRRRPPPPPSPGVPGEGVKTGHPLRFMSHSLNLHKFFLFVSHSCLFVGQSLHLLRVLRVSAVNIRRGSVFRPWSYNRPLRAIGMNADVIG